MPELTHLAQRCRVLLDHPAHPPPPTKHQAKLKQQGRLAMSLRCHGCVVAR